MTELRYQSNLKLSEAVELNETGLHVKGLDLGITESVNDVDVGDGYVMLTYNGTDLTCKRKGVYSLLSSPNRCFSRKNRLGLKAVNVEDGVLTWGNVATGKEGREIVVDSDGLYLITLSLCSPSEEIELFLSVKDGEVLESAYGVYSVSLTCTMRLKKGMVLNVECEGVSVIDSGGLCMFKLS